MFNIGNYVFNQRTGYFGKVIGYGHQIVKNGYETTLKVLVVEDKPSNKRGFVEEDLYSTWLQRYKD